MEGLNEEFVQNLSLILSKTLSNNNEERNMYESMYKQLFVEKTEMLLLSLIAVLRTSPVEIRTLSSVLLKNIFNPPSKTLKSISDQVRLIIQRELLTSLSVQDDRKVIEILSEDIGLLGVSVLTSTEYETKWPELLPFVYQATSSTGPLRSAGLLILKAMFPYLFDELMKNSSELLQIFKLCLADDDYNTRLSCISSMTSLISVADTKPCLAFSELVPEILRSVDYILEKNTFSGSLALEKITDLAQSEPKLFKNSFASCIELTQYVCNKQAIDVSIRNLALEFAVSISERIPRQVQKKSEIGVSLLKLIFDLMISIDLDVEDDWKVPEEGFCEKDEEEEGGVNIDYAKIGRKLISRLIDSVGDKYLLQPCLDSIQQALVVTGDWRVCYAALMTLSEVLQYVHDENRLEDGLPIIVNHLSSQHCKIRYAAFHVLGQIFEDHGPEFQKKYHEKVTQLLVLGLNDPVPRVLAHACAAITNFFENLDINLTAHYASVFLPKLSSFLQEQVPSIVVENSLTCIAAIAGELHDRLKDYYFHLLTLVLSLFDRYNNEKYKKLLGRIVECITIMSKSVGKAVFQPYADKIISILKSLQENRENQEELTGYLISGWQKICELLSEDFEIYADAVVPSLLKLVSVNVEASTSQNPHNFVELTLLTDDKDKEKKKRNISTTETENKELVLQTLITITEELKTSYNKYVDYTIQVAMPLLDFTLNESIRAAAAMLLSNLVSVVRPLDMVKAVTLAKSFIGNIWKAIDDEYMNETLVDELQAIREIIFSIEVPFLSPEEVNIIGEKSLNILEKSLENRIKVNEDSDDEEDESFQEYTKKEEDNLHTAISEVFGALFKTHKESSLPIVNFLYTKVFGKLLETGTRDEDHKFVIFVIDDILEFLGQRLVGDKWDSFGQVLIRFSCDLHDAVRQAAVYGLGVFVENSSTEGFQQWASLILTKLEHAISFPIGKNTKSHGHARDNAIASIGKLIKNHPSHLNLEIIVPAWLGLLPLKFDKIESRNINSLIVDLILTSPSVLLGTNNQNLKKIVSLLVDSLETKHLKDSCLPKVKEIFSKLHAAQSSEYQAVYQSLNEEQKAKINNLFSS